MASVAYALHNQFSVPPQAEWETPADHQESKSSGRYIDLQEQLEASQCNEESSEQGRFSVESWTKLGLWPQRTPQF